MSSLQKTELKKYMPLNVFEKLFPIAKKGEKIKKSDFLKNLDEIKRYVEKTQGEEIEFLPELEDFDQVILNKDQQNLQDKPKFGIIKKSTESFSKKDSELKELNENTNIDVQKDLLLDLRNKANIDLSDKRNEKYTFVQQEREKKEKNRLEKLEEDLKKAKTQLEKNKIRKKIKNAKFMKTKNKNDNDYFLDFKKDMFIYFKGRNIKLEPSFERDHREIGNYEYHFDIYYKNMRKFDEIHIYEKDDLAKFRQKLINEDRVIKEFIMLKFELKEFKKSNIRIRFLDYTRKDFPKHYMSFMGIRTIFAASVKKVELYLSIFKGYLFSNVDPFFNPPLPKYILELSKPTDSV